MKLIKFIFFYFFLTSIYSQPNIKTQLFIENGFDDIINTSNLVPVVFYIPTSGTASVVNLPSAVSASSISESTTTVTGTTVNVQ